MRDAKVSILKTLAAQEVPGNLDGWPAVQRQLQAEPKARRGATHRPATRLGWAGVLLALFLTLGAAVYAGGPVISKLFGSLPGWRHVEETHLAQELNPSQTRDGVTVVLERAYADANQIIIGYTVQRGETGLQPGDVTLTNEQGQVIPAGPVGFGVSGSSDILGVTLPPGEESMVMTFDASGVQGAPSELGLRLSISLSRVVAVERDPMGSGAYRMRSELVGEPTELIGFDVTPAGQPVEGIGGPDKQIRIAGPWVFRLQVP